MIYYVSRKRKLEENGSSKSAEAPTKRAKTESKAADKQEDLIRKQNKLLFKNRDTLEAELKKSDWCRILSSNKQELNDGAGPKEVVHYSLCFKFSMLQTIAGGLRCNAEPYSRELV